MVASSRRCMEIKIKYNDENRKEYIYKNIVNISTKIRKTINPEHVPISQQQQNLGLFVKFFVVNRKIFSYYIERLEYKSELE